MKDFKQSACALLILIFTNCWLNAIYASDPQVEPETVKKIKKVATQVLTTNPPQLVVTVSGEVPSGGFTDVKLVRVSYRNPPQDGIQDYYLKAVAPTQPAIAVISEVKATDTWKGMPFWVKGIRVHGVDDGVKEVLFKEGQLKTRPRMRRFKGTSKQGSYEDALKQALANLNQAMAEDGVRDATATWKVDAVQGVVGGIAGLNELSVVIVAKRQPAWKIESAAASKSKPKKSE
ncbi:MAG: hypothetical protein KDA70_01330 [Planctomycetaceae bacterium]|nr:hypothetical protein [Planctomycetaceae bacterium]